MVVLKPLLEGERERACTVCERVGLASPHRERSCFYRSKSRAGKYLPRCRYCDNKAGRARTTTERDRLRWKKNWSDRVARMTAEERVEQCRRDAERQRQRLAHDPEVVRASRRATRARQRSKMSSTTLQNLTIDAVLRQERQGKKLKSKRETHVHTRTSGESLPIEPFRAWVSALYETQKLLNRKNPNVSSKSQVADMLGVCVRRVTVFLTEMTAVDYDVVDRVVSEHGGTTVEEVYRVYGGMTIECDDDGKFLRVNCDGAPLVTQAREEREARAEAAAAYCRSPRCAEPVLVAGGRWCAGHAATFARLRGKMEEDNAAIKDKKKRKDKRSTCCRPGCASPRLRSERYCEECQADGWDEGDLV